METAKKPQQKDFRNELSRREVVLFGWDKFSAAMNMAIDEVLLKKADGGNRFFLRFYDFAKPAVILSLNDDHQLVKKLTNIDLCRRVTGGRPIYVDDNVMGYSIAGPMKGDGELKTLTDIHKITGQMLEETINGLIEKGHEVKLGNMSSIRVDDKPIAGHAISSGINHSFLYQGVIVIKEWDLKAIEKLLYITDQDIEDIKSLPNLRGLSQSKDSRSALLHKQDVVSSMISKIPKGSLVAVSDDEKFEILNEAAKLCEEKYSNDIWTYKKGALRFDVRFCILFEDGPKPK